MTSNYTRAMLDDIALNNNGFLGKVDDLPRSDLHGYGFARIKTGGSKNGGYAILVSRSPEASKLLYEGKIRMLLGYGIRKQHVKAVYNVIKTIQHGLEPAVLDFVMDKYTNEIWDTYPESLTHKDFWVWFNQTGMSDDGLTPPRIQAAWKIIQELRRLS